MLLRECYEFFGGDFESVKERITNEEVIKKFVIRKGYVLILDFKDFGNWLLN